MEIQKLCTIFIKQQLLWQISSIKWIFSVYANLTPYLYPLTPNWNICLEFHKVYANLSQSSEKFEKYYEICMFTVLAISASSAENDEVVTAKLWKTSKHHTTYEAMQWYCWKVFLEVSESFLKSEVAIRSFYKIGVLKNFEKFKEKHLCWGLFFNPSILKDRHNPSKIKKWFPCLA